MAIGFVECGYGPEFNRTKKTRGRGGRFPRSRVIGLGVAKHPDPDPCSPTHRDTSSFLSGPTHAFMLRLCSGDVHADKQGRKTALQHTHARTHTRSEISKHIPVVLLVMQQVAHDLNRVRCMISYRTKASHRAN